MVEDDSFSCTRGYSFSFEDNGNIINAWFSAFSGKEKVFVNGKLISSQRNFSKNSVNTFTLNDDTYSTTLNVESLLKGPFICTLTKNNKPYKRKKLIFQNLGKNGNMKSFIYGIIPYIILGLILGVAELYFQLSDMVVWGIIIGVVFLHSIYDKKTKKHNDRKPKIIEEEIV